MHNIYDAFKFVSRGSGPWYLDHRCVDISELRNSILPCRMKNKTADKDQKFYNL